MTRDALARSAARLFAAAGVVAVSLLGTAGAATAADNTTASVGDIRVDITSYGPPVLEPGSGLFASVALENSALVAANDLAVTLSLTDAPITERAQLATWQSGESSLDTHEVARRLVLGDGVLPASTNVATTAIADTNALALGSDPWAVYGVVISVVLADETVKEYRTFATYLSSDPPVTPVAVVATAAGSPERVAAILSAAHDSRIAVLVDPTALQKAPDATIATPSSGVFTLPAGHVDIASLSRAGDSAILETALAASAAVDGPSNGRPWMAVVPSLDQETLAAAQAHDAAAVLVQPGSGSTAPVVDDADDGPAPPLVRATTGGPVIISPDPGLSVALAGTRTASALRPAGVVAESALLAASNTDGRTVVVSPGTSWMLESDTHRSSALDTLGALPWIRFVSLSSVLDRGEPVATTVPETVTGIADIPTSVVGTASTRLRDLGYLAAASSDPSSIFSGPSAAIFAALSYENRTDTTARAAAIDRALAGAQDVLDQVSLPSGSSLNLISTSGNVPITVTNNLDAEVTVTVVFSTRSNNLVVKGRPTVTLAPGASAQVPIPVEAISSANVTATVHLTDGEGHRLTGDTVMHLRVRADWGTAFTVGVGAAAVLLLIGGIWRTVRRGRKGTRGIPGAEPLPFDGED